MNKITILVSVGCLSLSACKQEYAQQENRSSSNTKVVQVTTVSTLQEAPLVVATGRVASREEVVLSFKTGGIVQQLALEEGQAVAPQQAMARLDLQEIDAQLRSADRTYQQAVRDYERANQLYQDTVGTLAQLESTETAKEVAEAQRNIARFNRQYSAINAPLQGNVLERYVEVGELVSAGQPIYRVGSAGTDRAKILRLGLSDRDVVKIRLGDPGTTSFDAFPGVAFSGEVTEIAESADAATGLFEVELSFTEDHPALKNGFVGKARIAPSQPNGNLKMPINALVEGSGNRAVVYYTKDGATAQRAEVDVVDIGKDYFLATRSSFPETGAVVVKGASYLRDQDSIRVVP